MGTKTALPSVRDVPRLGYEGHVAEDGDRLDVYADWQVLTTTH